MNDTIDVGRWNLEVELTSSKAIRILILMCIKSNVDRVYTSILVLYGKDTIGYENTT